MRILKLNDAATTPPCPSGAPSAPTATIARGHARERLRRGDAYGVRVCRCCNRAAVGHRSARPGTCIQRLGPPTPKELTPACYASLGLLGFEFGTSVPASKLAVGVSKAGWSYVKAGATVIGGMKGAAKAAARTEAQLSLDGFNYGLAGYYAGTSTVQNALVTVQRPEFPFAGVPAAFNNVRGSCP